MTDGTERKDGSAPGQGRKPTLTLNRTQSGGTVKQSFSHGRSKQVAVEVKTRRTVAAPPTPGAAPQAPRPPVAPPTAAAPQAPRPQQAQPPGAPARPPAAPRPQGQRPTAAGPAPLTQRPREITDEEQRRRHEAVQRSLAEQQARAERQRVEEEQRRAREEAARRLQEEEEARQRLLAEQQRRQEEAARAEQEADRPPAARTAEAPPAAREQAAPAARAGAGEPDRAAMLAELGGRVKRAKAAAPPPAKPARDKNAEGRRTGKLTLDMVERMAEGDDEKVRSLAAMRRAREKERERRMQALRGGGDQNKVVREVVVPEVITVQELANRMAERVADVVKYMMKQGQMVRAIDVLDADTAELIVTDFGHTVKRVAESDIEEGIIGEDDALEDMKPRPPVVTVMGHVDHGKTSLLDALRQTDVASGEAGGITQHIGAYQVRLSDGQRVTFLDTPGHAAFSSMRARGAQVTDIVVLVVAADDGVMPQTIEALNHAKAAKVPMIVAINKMDKPDANPQRVINELLQYEVVTEVNGGDVQAVEVSALKKIGLDSLVEAILLQSEVLQLTANPDRPAEGVVIESKLDRGRGSVATVLVKRGTLKRGDIVIAGAQWGRVRALSNERGQMLQQAGPSEPVEIMGLEGVPDPGDIVAVVESENRAREIAEYRQRVRREKQAVPPTARTSLEQMMAKLKENVAKELVVVVKADVQGSAEAIQNALEKLGTDEVRCRVIHSAVGAINESDVLLAKASNAPIIGFNVRASKEARDLAEREGVEIRYYAIIYDVIDDIKGVMSGMLAPINRETPLGIAEILEVFQISKVGRVAGCLVREGKMVRGQRVRLLRDNVVIHEGGKLNTLQRFKDAVNEVQTGQECGMSFENYQDIKKGDIIECYSLEVVQRTL